LPVAPSTLTGLRAAVFCLFYILTFGFAFYQAQGTHCMLLSTRLSRVVATSHQIQSLELLDKMPKLTLVRREVMLPGDLLPKDVGDCPGKHHVRSML
jgi:hypothetical protein